MDTLVSHAKAHEAATGQIAPSLSAVAPNDRHLQHAAALHGWKEALTYLEGKVTLPASEGQRPPWVFGAVNGLLPPVSSPGASPRSFVPRANDSKDLHRECRGGMYPSLAEHLAAIRASSEEVRAPLQATLTSVSPDVHDRGRTVLHHAAKYKWPMDAYRALLDHGLSMMTPDYSGVAPWHLMLAQGSSLEALKALRRERPAQCEGLPSDAELDRLGSGWVREPEDWGELARMPVSALSLPDVETRACWVRDGGSEPRPSVERVLPQPEPLPMQAPSAMGRGIPRPADASISGPMTSRPPVPRALPVASSSSAPERQGPQGWGRFGHRNGAGSAGHELPKESASPEVPGKAHWGRFTKPAASTGQGAEGGGASAHFASFLDAAAPQTTAKAAIPSRARTPDAGA